VPTTGGPHTLSILTGTYTSTSYLNLNQAYSTLTTVCTTTGSQDVTITGGSGSYNVLQGNVISNLLFSNLTFTARSGSSYLLVFNENGSSGTISNLNFVNCIFNGQSNLTTTIDAQSGSATSTQYVGFVSCTINGLIPTSSAIQIANGTALTNTTYGLTNCTINAAGIAVANQAGFVNLTGCTVYSTGTNLNYPALYTFAGGNAPLVAWSITNCTVTSGGQGAVLQFGALNVANSTFLGRGATASGLVAGEDAASGQTVTGTISGCTFFGDQGEALIIGAGCLNMSVVSNVVHGGTDAIVLKRATNCLLTGCSGFSSFGNCALLLKGAVCCTVTNNLIAGADRAYALACYDGDPTYTSVSNTVKFNRIISTGAAASLLYWPTAGDGGANVIDSNTYLTIRGSIFGTVLSSTNLSSLAAVQAAWSGYGVVGNDQHSRDVTTPLEFASPY